MFLENRNPNPNKKRLCRLRHSPNNIKNKLLGKKLENDYKNSNNIVDLHFQTAVPLIIPNKDGTETIINPNGTVKTVHNDNLEIPSHRNLSEDMPLEETNKKNIP